MLATRSPAVAREVGIAVTCCAFFADLYEDRPQTNYWLAAGLIAVATAAIAWFVHRTRCTVQLFLLITWTAVADSLIEELPAWAAQGGTCGAGDLRRAGLRD